MVSAVTRVVRAGRQGSALFQRESGGLGLRTVVGGGGGGGAAGVGFVPGGDGGFDLADAGARPPGVQQACQDGAADVAGEVGGAGDDVPGFDEEVFGGLQGDGEAGAVGVGAGDGLGGGDHGPAQCLVEGQ